ncbi:hypothetical protein AYO47_06795 [Planctomyces sp. SCGC AG-212-M04]|nr:hypothetical protein AYO47_06795 [Planctomyces sp. SCGC AG-212-M04]
MRRCEGLVEVAELQMSVAIDQTGKQGNLAEVQRSSMRPVVDVDDEAIRDFDNAPVDRRAGDRADQSGLEAMC